jgi:hypothetical protein
VDAQFGEGGLGPLHSVIHERVHGGDGSVTYRKATEDMLAYLMGPRGGISLHSLDKQGRNALHILAGTQATKNENESESEQRAKSEARMHLVQHLVAKGICRGGGVNVREKEAGHSPLHECAAKGDTELLALLCKHGGDVLLRNVKGNHLPAASAHARLCLLTFLDVQAKRHCMWHAAWATGRLCRSC